MNPYTIASVCIAANICLVVINGVLLAVTWRSLKRLAQMEGGIR